MSKRGQDRINRKGRMNGEVGERRDKEIREKDGDDRKHAERKMETGK